MTGVGLFANAFVLVYCSPSLPFNVYWETKELGERLTNCLYLVPILIML